LSYLNCSLTSLLLIGAPHSRELLKQIIVLCELSSPWQMEGLFAHRQTVPTCRFWFVCPFVLFSLFLPEFLKLYLLVLIQQITYTEDPGKLGLIGCHNGHAIFRQPGPLLHPLFYVRDDLVLAFHY